MFVRKVWHSTKQPHEADPGYDQWSLILQAKELVFARTTGGNDDAKASFERDRTALKELFVRGAQGQPWGEPDFKKISRILKRWGCRG